MTAPTTTLFGFSVGIFTAIRLIPGKFEEVPVPRATQVIRAALAQKLGLDYFSACNSDPQTLSHFNSLSRRSPRNPHAEPYPPAGRADGERTPA